jgi:hypothetical protein
MTVILVKGNAPAVVARLERSICSLAKGSKELEGVEDSLASLQRDFVRLTTALRPVMRGHLARNLHRLPRRRRRAALLRFAVNALNVFADLRTRSVTRYIALAFVGITSASYATSVSRPMRSCVAPNPAAFLRAFHASLDIPKGIDPLMGSPRSVSRQFGKPSELRWFGLEWSAPTGGVLAVVNCSGAPLTSLGLGGIEAIGSGPLLPDGSKSYAVEYTSGTGTGFQQRKVALVRFDSRKIRVVWSHTIFELVSGWSDVEDHEDRISWRYREANKMIHVQIERQAANSGGRVRSNNKHLPAIDYCWMARRHVFEQCRRERK